MFSGIIQSVGVVKDIQQGDGERLFTVADSTVTEQTVLGSSVCTSGVCLTVREKHGDEMVFGVMDETIQKTTMGNWQIGRRVNLESSLKLGDEISGHFVFGHVDGVGMISDREVKDDGSVIFTVTPPKQYMPYIAPKGSVSLDGVSLTVVDVSEESFSVSLVAYTLAHTTLNDLGVGDTIHIEVDMLARYVARQIEMKQ